MSLKSNSVVPARTLNTKDLLNADVFEKKVGTFKVEFYSYTGYDQGNLVCVRTLNALTLQDILKSADELHGYVKEAVLAAELEYNKHDPKPLPESEFPEIVANSVARQFALTARGVEEKKACETLAEFLRNPTCNGTCLDPMGLYLKNLYKVLVPKTTEVHTYTPRDKREYTLVSTMEEPINGFYIWDNRGDAMARLTGKKPVGNPVAASTSGSRQQRPAPSRYSGYQGPVADHLES